MGLTGVRLRMLCGVTSSSEDSCDLVRFGSNQCTSLTVLQTPLVSLYPTFSCVMSCLVMNCVSV